MQKGVGDYRVRLADGEHACKEIGDASNRGISVDTGGGDWSSGVDDIRSLTRQRRYACFTPPRDTTHPEPPSEEPTENTAATKNSVSHFWAAQRSRAGLLHGLLTWSGIYRPAGSSLW